MNTRTRIAKLEGARPANAGTDNRQFKQLVGVNGDEHTFYIDGAQVNASIYARELKAYDQSHAGEYQKISVTILGLDGGEL